MDKLNNMSLEQIKNCKYISSVGMLMSLDELNIIKYHKEPSKITHNFQNILNGYDGCTIYVKFAFLQQFMYNVLPHIKYRFILVTGDGDETMPYDMFNADAFNKFINNDNIIHWYSVNCIESIHPKLSLFPIGVNFHSLSFGEFCGWHHSAQTPLEQENIIDEIKASSPLFFDRKSKCYSNFHFVTYNEFGNPRKDAMNKIPSDLVFYEPSFIPRIETWKNQSEYAFVLSPMGHGMDCHRTWEALMLGCVVIVKKSELDSLYEELPVLIVDDWSEINEPLLLNTMEDFKNKTFNYDKITLNYWVNKIKNVK